MLPDEPKARLQAGFLELGHRLKDPSGAVELRDPRCLFVAVAE